MHFCRAEFYSLMFNLLKIKLNVYLSSDLIKIILGNCTIIIQLIFVVWKCWQCYFRNLLLTIDVINKMPSWIRCFIFQFFACLKCTLLVLRYLAKVFTKCMVIEPRLVNIHRLVDQRPWNCVNTLKCSHIFLV